MKGTQFITIFLLLSLFCGRLLAQSTVWSKQFSTGESSETLQDISQTSNGDLLCVGFSVVYGFPESMLLKFDSSGNNLWHIKSNFDTLPKGSIDFIEKVPHENNNFYIGGEAFNPSGWNNDFIAKIDSSGDTLWIIRFNYSTFYNTKIGHAILQDKSIVTVGYKQLPNTLFDFTARRIDSTGGLVWEKDYKLPGSQIGYDIVEMLDGSLLLVGESDGQNMILRISFNGSLIDTSNIPSIIGSIDHLHAGLLPANKLFVMNDAWNGNWYTSQLLEISYDLSSVQQSNSNDWLRSNFNVLTDSSIIFTRSPEIDSVFLTSGNLMGSDNNLLLPNQNLRVSPLSQYQIDSVIFLGGAIIQSTNQSYWISKVESISPKWVPDRCVYQPPIAGFEYEYNYPVLTLRDTSSGGLKYLDTVYSWEWTSSLGQGGNMDSTEIFLDTAMNKSIDIQLVISNWYGCTDTVNRTLTFDPNGISEIKESEVKIYPNPVKDRLQIELGQYDLSSHFTLFDLHGRVKLSQPLANSNSEINLSKLPQGLYIYEVKSNSQVKRGKVVKE